MRKVLFQYRRLTIYSYPAMLYIGIVCGVVGGTSAARLHGTDPARLLAADLLLLVPALIGSRVLFLALHWRTLHRDPRRLWRRSEGGAAMYGGLALAVVCSFLVLPALGIGFGEFWDAGIITILIGMVMTRIGCLLNGCCAGKPSDGLFGVCLPDSRGVWKSRFPTPLFEAGLGLALLIVSFVLWDDLPFDGALFLGNVAAYGSGRWLLDLTRDGIDEDGPVRTHRAISAWLASISAGLLVVLNAIGVRNWHVVHVAAARHSSGGAYMLVTPLAVLAVLSLFHFVGCDHVFGLENFEYVDGDYAANIVGETNSATVDPANSITVAYWRLGEFSGPAKDHKGSNDGTYETVTLPPLPNTDLDQDHSPTTAQPQGTILQSVCGDGGGLLGNEPHDSNCCMQVNGGFVEVPATPALDLPQFTIEALLSPEWDLSQQGRWYCVVEHTSPVGAKQFGVAIYAGPQDIFHLNTPYRWQVWLGETVAGVTKVRQITPVTPPARPLPIVQPNVTNYLAVTFDGSTVRLWSSFDGKFANADITQDQVLAVEETLPGSFALNPVGVPFRIGMGRDLFTPFNATGDARYPFDGKMQEVAVYNQALTFERVLSHMAAAFKDI